MTDLNDLVVTVTPTIMDGTVVRWYRSFRAADHGAELASASRNGYRFRGLLTEADGPLIATVCGAHLALKAGQHETVQGLATHRHAGLLGPLEPIAKEAP